MPTLDLVLIFGIPVEECLDFEFVDPATQAVPELSLEPKVKAPKSLPHQFKKPFDSLYQKVTDDISQHSLNTPGPIHMVNSCQTGE